MSRRPAGPGPEPRVGSTADTWKFWPLLLLPIACCAVPLLITALAAVSAAALGAGSAVVVILALGVAAVILQRHRRRCAPGDDLPAETNTREAAP